MIDTPQITETDAQFHLTIPRAEIQSIMRPGLGACRT